MRVFALEASRDFGEAVAKALGRPLDPHEERDFEDGEHKARPLISVRGADCYVIQSLHAGPDMPASEKLIRLLFFAGALRQSGAARVTALTPYLAYARKDRRTKPRDPVTTRYVAELMEAAGLAAVVTLEVHNVVAFENAFRIRAEHLAPYDLFAEPAGRFAGKARLVVASPDPGGVKRVQIFREQLEARLKREVGSAYLEKRRSGGQVTGSLVAGEVEGAHVIILDDMIASGGTMLRAAEALKGKGAARIAAFAAHGLFMEGAERLFTSDTIDSLVVTDTVPPFRLPALHRTRLEIVSAAPLFAQAIDALAGGGFSDLMAL